MIAYQCPMCKGKRFTFQANAVFRCLDGTIPDEGTDTDHRQPPRVSAIFFDSEVDEAVCDNDKCEHVATISEFESEML